MPVRVRAATVRRHPAAGMHALARGRDTGGRSVAHMNGHDDSPFRRTPMAGPRHAPAGPRAHRWKHWLAWLVVVAVLLGAYLVALRWVTLRVETGAAASVHHLPDNATAPEQADRSPLSR